MSNFSFKDDEDPSLDLSALPTMQETPPVPTIPKIAASSAAAPTTKSPTAPSPTATKSPAAPSPALPKVLSSPNAAATRAPVVPSPTLPTAPSANTASANAASATAPSISRAPAARQNAVSPTPSTSVTSTSVATTSVATAKVPQVVVPLPPLRDEDLQREAAHRPSLAVPKVKNVSVTSLERVLDFLTPFAMWLMRASLVLGGLALAYIVYGAVSGALTQGGNDARIVSNMGVATNALRWALLGLALVFCLTMWDERAIGAVVVGAGLALYFGAPPLLRMVGTTEALRTIAASLSVGGRALAALGLLKCAYDVAMWTIELPSRMISRADVGVSTRAELRQQREALSATMFSPCWKLPFCREVIRKQCPAYIAKTTCWKFGRGCYCDEEMISRIIRGEAHDDVKAPTRMSRQGKPPCGRCHIFLEHQGLKYKVVSPLAIPITIATMYFGWPLYMALTGKIGHSLQFLWDKLSFSGSTVVTGMAGKLAEQTAKSNSTLSSEQVQQAAQTMCGVLLGFYFLIALSKGIEWAIYKARL